MKWFLAIVTFFALTGADFRRPRARDRVFWPRPRARDVVKTPVTVEPEPVAEPPRYRPEVRRWTSTDCGT